MSVSGGTRPDVLFGNVRVFDGVSASLSEPSNVLVRGNTIAAVAAHAIPADAAQVARNGPRSTAPGGC